MVGSEKYNLVCENKQYFKLAVGKGHPEIQKTVFPEHFFAKRSKNDITNSVEAPYVVTPNSLAFQPNHTQYPLHLLFPQFVRAVNIVVHKTEDKNPAAFCDQIAA